MRSTSTDTGHDLFAFFSGEQLIIEAYVAMAGNTCHKDYRGKDHLLAFQWVIKHPYPLAGTRSQSGNDLLINIMFDTAVAQCRWLASQGKLGNEK